MEGGSFGAAVVVEGDGTMNVNGGSFTGTGIDKVTYGNGAKGTVSGGSFAELYLYGSGTAWLAGGSFTKLSTASFGVLSTCWRMVRLTTIRAVAPYQAAEFQNLTM